MSTSGKSAKRSKAIDRPFNPRVLKQAREIARRYQIVLQVEENGYLGRCLELPLVMGDGKTADECIANVRDAVIATVAFMLEDNNRPPTPAADQTRSVQLNIRLTSSEKAILEQAAQQRGFRGVSDYVRHAALTHRDA
jgi:predicted RNase H-like HicB family nuclease